MLASVINTYSVSGLFLNLSSRKGALPCCRCIVNQLLVSPDLGIDFNSDNIPILPELKTILFRQRCTKQFQEVFVSALFC